MARPRGDTFSNTPVLLVQPRSNMRTRAGIVIAGEIRGTWRSCSRRTAAWLPPVHLDTDDNDTVPDKWKLAGSTWLSLPVAIAFLGRQGSSRLGAHRLHGQPSHTA